MYYLKMEITGFAYAYAGMKEELHEMTIIASLIMTI
jgi:hypothetical protein